MEPKVSVFLPYYNDEKYIRKSVESILSQTFRDFELILVNHASTDSTEQIVKSYDDERIIHVSVEKNAGAGTSLLIEKAKPFMHGKYLKCFCADDELHPDALEKFVGFMEDNGLDFCFSDADYVDENSNPMNERFSDDRPEIKQDLDSSEIIKHYFSDYNVIPWCSLFMKRECLDSVELNYSLIFSVDKFLCLDLLVNGFKFRIIHDSLVNYRVHEGQVVSRKKGKDWLDKQFDNEIMNKFELLNLPGKFYGIKDLNLVKELCRDVEISKRLSSSDTELFPAVIDMHFLQVFHPALNYTAYLHLQSMLQDDAIRESMETKLGFGIREFRALYKKAGLNSSIYFNFGIKRLATMLCTKIKNKILRKRDIIINNHE